MAYIFRLEGPIPEFVKQRAGEGVNSLQKVVYANNFAIEEAFPKIDFSKFKPLF